MNIEKSGTGNKFHKLGFALCLSAILLPGCKTEDEKPNILWITIEDTSPQFVGFYGNQKVKTPIIDRLAREGVIFNNAFATNPVCSASRSNLITGVNNGQLGSGNHRSQFPLPEYIRGFPKYLREQGIYTSNNVKTDYSTSNEKEVIAASWDESSSKAGWWNRAEGQRFFSVVNFIDCHQSRTMTNPWNWYVENIFSKLSESDITRPEDIEVPPFYRDTEEMRKNLSRVYNSLNYTDIQIGKLLDSLQRDGLMESTIIFFFADHGEGIPRGKSSSVGLGYRVPFFIWFPEKYKHLSPWKIGETTDELINFEDLPRTVLSIAGIQAPDYMTGRAILGPYRSEPVPFVFGARNRIDDSPDLVRTATDGNFFYTREFFPRYPSVLLQKYADVSEILRSIRKDHAEGNLSPVQSFMLGRRDSEYLYDLKNDPWEVNNLAKDPKYADKLAELRKACYERLVWNKDLHFLPEYEIAEIAKTTTPYEFGKNDSLNMKVVIDAAYEATDPATDPRKLFDLLSNENPYIRYWAATGIHNNLQKDQIDREKLRSALNDNYAPVSVEVSAILWEVFGEADAKKTILKHLQDQNQYIALQSAQMILYMDEVPDDMLNMVEQVLEKRSKSLDGYKSVYELNSCCEFILYKFRGKPLFIPEFEKWTDPKFLVEEKRNFN